MASYYYFVATLPTLMDSAVPPFGYADFMARAAGQLKPGDFRILDSARLSIPEDGQAPDVARLSSLLTRYYQWDASVRNELVRLRSQRLQKPADRHLKPGLPEWEGIKTAQTAFLADDPLQGELLIERDRWAFIEILAANNFFNMEYLVAYALKLQALERRQRFKAELGEEGYRTVYRSVLDTADYRDESGETR
ncbi:MAG: hypothetical protein A3J97_14065 [Spirochaetes bacterium RIFOXYC1_FULL_54_7]|nr:MAG: hypothetical protein A3J97_14065 [Spirochaetes bacterium RIFOXYC1_FULL_54_7]